VAALTSTDLGQGNNTASDFSKVFVAEAKKLFLSRYVIAAIRAVKRLKA
jgi:hypothetical protein